MVSMDGDREFRPWHSSADCDVLESWQDGIGDRATLICHLGQFYFCLGFDLLGTSSTSFIMLLSWYTFIAGRCVYSVWWRFLIVCEAFYWHFYFLLKIFFKILIIIHILIFHSIYFIKFSMIWIINFLILDISMKNLILFDLIHAFNMIIDWGILLIDCLFTPIIFGFVWLYVLQYLTPSI